MVPEVGGAGEEALIEGAGADDCSGGLNWDKDRGGESADGDDDCALAGFGAGRGGLLWGEGGVVP